MGPASSPHGLRGERADHGRAARRGTTGARTRSAPWPRSPPPRSPSPTHPLVAAYHGELDAAGHRVRRTRRPGTSSSRTWTGWPSSSPPRCLTGAALYVTADHGMVNVGPEDRSMPMARPAASCATAWPCSAASRGSGTCTLRPAPPPTCSPPGGRSSASTPGSRRARRPIKDGWFGPPGGVVDDAMAARIGDVVAALRGNRGGHRLAGRAASNPPCSACTARSPRPSSWSRCSALRPFPSRHRRAVPSCGGELAPALPPDLGLTARAVGHLAGDR